MKPNLSLYQILLAGHHSLVKRPNFAIRSQPSSILSPPPRNPRWLSDQKSRLGKCITFGLQPDQIQEAGRLARILAEEWRGLVAGAEGFLVPAGAEGHGPETAWEERVTWGSQVSVLLM